MSDILWSPVEEFYAEKLMPHDPVLEAALADSAAAGLPEIQVAPPMGKFLHLLARMLGAKRILEIGTLGGYSAIWMARALPAEGKLISLEIDPRHAAVARGNLARAGVADRVEIRVGRAIELLPALAGAGGAGPFDLIFIDADKLSNADYFAWALKLSRPGTAIVVDNVVRKGAVVDAASGDENVRGVRRLAEMLEGEERVSATALQMVSTKGYDGIILAVVNAMGH